MATSTSWMPANGRHRVNVGTSLGRALKARKGDAPTKRHNLPDRDFYSFRYNFKPPSIDSTKSGTIDVKRGKGSTSVTVEHSSSQIGEGHLFVGSEQVAKETDCVLIYDEETGTFTLEKLDSYMTLTHERKTTTNPNRPSSSPLSAPLLAPSTSNEQVRDLDLEAQLERDLLSAEGDADGEPDNEFEEVVPYDTTALREEEEEDEEEDIAPPPRAPSPPKYKAVQHARQPAKSTSHSVPLAKSKAPAKSKAKARREAAALEVEAEVLEFGQPARQTKRIRASPPSAGLALPGSSSIVDSAVYASPLPSPHKSGITPTPSAPQPASDSEEDWDEVQPVLAAAHEAMSVDEGEDEEEIDMNAFEAEMNQQLNGSDDFLTSGILSEPENTQTEVNISARPMSLNQFASGGTEASQDEEDYTSSDDSDDD